MTMHVRPIDMTEHILAGAEAFLCWTGTPSGETRGELVRTPAGTWRFAASMPTDAFVDSVRIEVRRDGEILLASDTLTVAAGADITIDPWTFELVKGQTPGWLT